MKCKDCQEINECDRTDIAGELNEAIQNNNPIQCGNKEIDILAEILFEGRRCLIKNKTVVTLEALNVAIDMVSDMQENYRTLSRNKVKQ